MEKFYAESPVTDNTSDVEINPATSYGDLESMKREVQILIDRIDRDVKELQENKEKSKTQSKEFSEVEINMWKSGAERYKHLNIKDTEFTSEDKGDLQAMFLGEKPMTLLSKDLDEKTVEALVNNGLIVRSKCVYDPNQVKECMLKYPEVFKNFNTDNLDDVVDLIDKYKHQNYLARGLLLGFPEESVKAYEKEQKFLENHPVNKFFKWLYLQPGMVEFLNKNFRKDREGDREKSFNFLVEKMREAKNELGIREEDVPTTQEGFRIPFDPSKRSVDVHGVHWADYGESKQSQEKQERLRAAFEKSGILL